MYIFSFSDSTASALLPTSKWVTCEWSFILSGLCSSAILTFYSKLYGHYHPNICHLCPILVSWFIAKSIWTIMLQAIWSEWNLPIFVSPLEKKLSIFVFWIVLQRYQYREKWLSCRYFQYWYLTDTEKVSAPIPVCKETAALRLFMHNWVELGVNYAGVFPWISGLWVGNMRHEAHVFEFQQTTHNVCSASWMKGKPGNLDVHSSMLSQCMVPIRLLCTSFSITGNIYSDTCTRLAVEHADVLIWDMWCQVHRCSEESSILLNTPGLLWKVASQTALVQCLCKL